MANTIEFDYAHEAEVVPDTFLWRDDLPRGLRARLKTAFWGWIEDDLFGACFMTRARVPGEPFYWAAVEHCGTTVVRLGTSVAVFDRRLPFVRDTGWVE